MTNMVKEFLRLNRSSEAPVELNPHTIPDMLITDNIAVTPKIMVSMKLSVPIVSLYWVFDCIQSKRLFDPSSYILI